MHRRASSHVSNRGPDDEPACFSSVEEKRGGGEGAGLVACSSIYRTHCSPARGQLADAWSTGSPSPSHWPVDVPGLFGAATRGLPQPATGHRSRALSIYLPSHRGKRLIRRMAGWAAPIFSARTLARTHATHDRPCRRASRPATATSDQARLSPALPLACPLRRCPSPLGGHFRPTDQPALIIPSWDGLTFGSVSQILVADRVLPWTPASPSAPPSQTL